MNLWLHCTLSPGQFDGEFGVDGVQFNGTPFSLFVPREFVKYPQEPTKDRAVSGWIRVQAVKQEGELVLVLLPRPTFQNGPYVTVKPDQLEDSPAMSPKQARERNRRR